MMKILLCPDKFKGSATAEEVIDSIENGLLRVLPNAQIHRLAIADGGEGFSLTASRVLTGQWVECKTLDALHRPLSASYFISGSTAYIDMSAACGLDQIKPSDRNPMLSSTRGTGVMMRHAVENFQVDHLIIGLGGSATNDAGAGMAHALGIRFLDYSGAELAPIPAELIHCASINIDSLIDLPKITAACDVSNPLLGENGATYVYGPQKGMIALADCDAALNNLTLIGNGQLAATTAGAGAAGGLAYGLMHYTSAQLESGFDLTAEITALENAIEATDIVITGEGSLDQQTLNGKGPHGVAHLAKKHGKPVYAIAGNVEDCAAHHLTKCYSLSELGLPLETCMVNAQDLIADLAEKLARDLSSANT